MNRAEQIYELLSNKAVLKQKIFDNTLNAFKIFKEVMQNIEQEYNARLKEHDQRILLKFRDISVFQAELKVAGDLLVFYMHSNIFKFDRDHPVWNLNYLHRDRDAGYVGIINIYNFLADSFKYNREEDIGYLIARVFINKDNNYFVEGKKQTAYLSEQFESRKITQQAVRTIIENAIYYSQRFDLLVPPYENVKLATVKDIMDERKMGAPTGKRVGFTFKTDDVKSVHKIYYSGA